MANPEYTGGLQKRVDESVVPTLSGFGYVDPDPEKTEIRILLRERQYQDDGSCPVEDDSAVKLFSLDKIAEIKWQIYRIGGCGPFTLTLSDELEGVAEDSVEREREIEIQVRLADEDQFHVWFTGFVRTMYRDRIGQQIYTTLTGQGYVAQLARLSCGYHNVRTGVPIYEDVHFQDTSTSEIVWQILKQGVTYNEDWAYYLDGSDLIRVDDWTGGKRTSPTLRIYGDQVVKDFKFNGSVLYAMRALAELQGATEWGVDEDRDFFFMPEISTVKHNIFESDVAIEILQAGTDQKRANRIIAEGRTTHKTPHKTASKILMDYVEPGWHPGPDQRNTKFIQNGALREEDDLDVWANNLLDKTDEGQSWVKVKIARVKERYDAQDSDGTRPCGKTRLIFADGTDQTYAFGKVEYFWGSPPRASILGGKGSGKAKPNALNAVLWLGPFVKDLSEEIEEIKYENHHLRMKLRQIETAPKDANYLLSSLYDPGPDMPNALSFGHHVCMAGDYAGIPASGIAGALYAATDTGVLWRYSGNPTASWEAIADIAPGGGSAPMNAEYVTLALNARLTDERVLTGTSNQIILTDNGAGSTVVLSAPQDIHTEATPQFARLGLGVASDEAYRLLVGPANATQQILARFFTNDGVYDATVQIHNAHASVGHASIGFKVANTPENSYSIGIDRATGNFCLAASSTPDAVSLMKVSATGVFQLGKTSGETNPLTAQLSFAHASSVNLTTIQAGNADAAVTYTLPTVAATVSNQALISDATGAMSWGQAIGISDGPQFGTLGLGIEAPISGETRLLIAHPGSDEVAGIFLGDTDYETFIRIIGGWIEGDNVAGIAFVEGTTIENPSGPSGWALRGEPANLNFAIARFDGATPVPFLNFFHDTGDTPPDYLVFNQNAGDVDFHMHGDSITSLFFLDASTDRIGIGVTLPSALLHVGGDVWLGNPSAITGTLAFYNAGSGNETKFQAGAAAANVTYTFPTNAPAVNGYVLSCTTAGAMSWIAPGGGGGAPTDAQYLVLALNGTLTDERVFTPGTSLTATDDGAGGDYHLDVIQDVRTSAGPTFDHLHLGAASSSTGSISFNNATNANVLTIQSGVSAASMTYTLPTNYPAVSGYVLSSTDAGVLSWAAGGGTVLGSGTATRVAFWSAANTLSSSANLYWDNVNSRLGVGTASPSYALHVYDGTTDALMLIQSVQTNKSAQIKANAGVNLAGDPAIFIGALGTAYGGTTFGGVTGNSQCVIEAEFESCLYLGTYSSTTIRFGIQRNSVATITDDILGAASTVSGFTAQGYTCGAAAAGLDKFTVYSDGTNIYGMGILFSPTNVCFFTAGASDVVTIGQRTNNTTISAWLTATATLIYTASAFGVGTSTVPHGAVGVAKWAMDGTDASANGPHMQVTTSADNYPCWQFLTYSHDNMGLSFDCYWNPAGASVTGWWSSDAGSCFQIYKLSDLLQFRCAVTAVGSEIAAWTTTMVLTNAGRVGIGTTGPDAKLDVLATTEQLRLTYTDGSVYTSFTVDSSGDLTINATGTQTIISDGLKIVGNVGFYNTAITAKQTVSGARNDPEQALKSLLTALSTIGLVTDSTTAS